MNLIQRAMFKAADRIECRPNQFEFNEGAIPQDSSCGTQGCVLGWIAFEYHQILGTPLYAGIDELADRMSIVDAFQFDGIEGIRSGYFDSETSFYGAMAEANGEVLDFETLENLRCEWMYDHKQAAGALRVLARAMTSVEHPVAVAA